MEKIIDYLLSSKFIISIVTIMFCIMIYYIINKFISKILQNKNREVTKRKKTYLKLINSILRYLIIILGTIIILGINGINVTSIIAGLGLVSVIAGLALQDALKDIIMGFNLIVDNYFQVGDVLNIDGKNLKVTEIGLKVTKLKNIDTLDTIVIANRNINQAISISPILDIDIPLPYEEKISKIEKIINEKIIVQLKEIKEIENISYKGIQTFGDSAIFYRIRINSKPEYQAQVRRDANIIIKRTIDNEKVSIPYMQIDIHNKND